tara:strand:- start:1588 stop:2844 length:1257 start_codon:yes stop_codon:yes gene_type:complete
MSIRNVLLADILSATVNSGAGGLVNRVTVSQASDLAGALDSSKEYFIDGIIDMGAQSIEIPQGGLNLTGYNFDLSKLISSAVGYTMFNSPVVGSGNILGRDYAIEVTGATSKVYDIVSDTGNEAFEFSRVNYNDCTSLGVIDNYRQGLEVGSGRFGGSPSLTLKGVWVGGYRITTSIVRSLGAGMTEPLFKAGAGFEMQSRFLTDINVDLPPLAALFDFSATNFPNSSTLQAQGVIVTRDGASDATDTNITPNIIASNLSCSWTGNNGMSNTFVGGAITNTAEIATNIVTQNVAVDLNGTFATSDLQHFDSPSNGRLRHLGSTPREFSIVFDFVVDGKDNDNYEIILIKIDTLANVTVEYQQTRTINNLQGGRDVGYFSGVADVILNKNDLIFWQVANLLDTDDCTLEIGSQWRVKAR